MKRINKIIASGALATTAALGAGMALAPAASADVLVNYDGGTIHLGQDMKVGVWYQAYSGGSRYYWLGVYNVKGKRVFERSGHASPTAWQFWEIKATQKGNYHTLYYADGKWLKIMTKVK
ncbi:MAG TPA: hypothetical protein VLW50_00385 [Streptosporangiaceae bacterium]|nr:hypothetical protein [Streptosporangiaceae bacterium]